MQMRNAVALQLDHGNEHQRLLKLASQVYAHLAPDGLQVGDLLCHVETGRHFARIERQGDEAAQNANRIPDSRLLRLERPWREQRGIETSLDAARGSACATSEFAFVC